MFVTIGSEIGFGFWPHVSLQNDDAIFGSSPHTTLAFEGFAKVFQVIVTPGKSGDSGCEFVAFKAIQMYSQVLLLRGHGWLEMGILPRRHVVRVG